MASQQNYQLEESVCGFKEPVLFWLWSAMAGRPDESRLVGLTDIEDIALRSIDGRTLRGYRLYANGKYSSETKGALLVLQGNAILADQLLTSFQRFARAGYDVYIFDFRGYGRSDGRRRLKAIVNDYREILALIDSRAYNTRIVYAMSLGGIIFLNALAQNHRVDRLVIDSTPSRLSTHGCPISYDPIARLPMDCSNMLLIVGGSDSVVSPQMSREMVELAEQRGAKVERREAFSHPFMDASFEIHEQRMRLIKEFLVH